mmetsp:Transcript_119728/g.284436  ORF Transcript_119728/g.284436 Transcript_119728/m.284436 type:complete len:368 (+) Transcript_119728:188-1291(+)
MALFAAMPFWQDLSSTLCVFITVCSQQGPLVALVLLRQEVGSNSQRGANQQQDTADQRSHDEPNDAQHKQPARAAEAAGHNAKHRVHDTLEHVLQAAANAGNQVETIPNTISCSRNGLEAAPHCNPSKAEAHESQHPGSRSIGFFKGCRKSLQRLHSSHQGIVLVCGAAPAGRDVNRCSLTSLHSTDDRCSGVPVLVVAETHASNRLGTARDDIGSRGTNGRVVRRDGCISMCRWACQCVCSFELVGKAVQRNGVAHIWMHPTIARSTTLDEVFAHSQWSHLDRVCCGTLHTLRNIVWPRRVAQESRTTMLSRQVGLVHLRKRAGVNVGISPLHVIAVDLDLRLVLLGLSSDRLHALEHLGFLCSSD